MANSKSVYVYAKLSVDALPLLAGRLDFFEGRVDFRYSKSWLESAGSFAFHPDLLPLDSSIRSAHALEGALSVFRDAGPGAWGREVIKRRYGQVDLSDYLVLSNNLLRIGVFRFSKEAAAQRELDAKIPQCDLNEVYAAVHALENGEPLSELQAVMLAQGSSMDGMRPKSFVEIEGTSWIVKFPSKHDYDNKAVNELIGMRLAQACGIETPEVRLIALGDNKSALAIKRFDTNSQHIFPLMSAASAMGYAEGEQVKKDYRYIAQALIRLSSNPQADCLSLFRRMVLNVLISNRDDHIFNQALIMKNGRWQLSPVYDVVCGEGNSRSHAMTIGKFGATGNLSNVLSAASSFGLDENRAKQVIDEVREVVAGWQQIAEEIGTTKRDIQSIAWAIAHADVMK